MTREHEVLTVASVERRNYPLSDPLPEVINFFVGN